MRIHYSTDDLVKAEVIDILKNKPLTAYEIKRKLQGRNILISYARLRRILDELVREGSLERYEEGNKILYITQYLLKKK